MSDARTLRALAHPVRIALIETLSLYGTMTATEASERIGESPTTCSFHLRQLAKYGFVEEAGRGEGRRRPWKMSSIGMRISTDGEDLESELAAGGLARLLRERQLKRYSIWLETKSSYPRAWQAAAEESEYVFYLTHEELEELNRELFSLLYPRCRERLSDPGARPPGAVPVELLIFEYPLRPPPEETGR